MVNKVSMTHDLWTTINIHVTVLQCVETRCHILYQLAGIFLKVRKNAYVDCS